MSLGMELSKVLWKEEPKLLVCDLEASARAAAEVSNLLGCILANVLAKSGDDAYWNACKAVMLNMDKSAHDTVAKAGRIVPNTTAQ